jgi:predicted metal-binding protein
MTLKKLLIAILLIAFVLMGIAATSPPAEPKFKNLKTLPKNISHEELDKIMDSFKKALGVKCNFCHAPAIDPANGDLDFASDEKPEKKITRKMMKMTGKLNKKYFTFNKSVNRGPEPVISCLTCHRGHSQTEERH